MKQAPKAFRGRDFLKKNILYKGKKILWPIIKFEFVLGILLSLVAFPLMGFLFSFILKFSGFTYLDQSNFIEFLKKPLTIVGMLLFTYGVSIVTIFEINGLNLAYINGKNKKTMTTMELIKSTFSLGRHMFVFKNFLLFVYIVLFLPLAGVVYKNPIIEKLVLPGFILDFIYESGSLTIILIAIYLLVFFVSVTSIYVFVIMLAEKRNYNFAVKKSWRLFFQKKKILLPKLFLRSFLVAIVGYGIYQIQTLALKWSLSIKGMWYQVIITASVLFFGMISGVFVSALGKIALLYAVNETYFQNHKLPEIEMKMRKQRIGSRPNLVLTFIIIFILFICVVLAIGMPYILEPKDMIIMAHRGSSIKELENTKEAFLKAIDDGVKFIELDVVKTKDDKVIVFHDLNLKRLAGLDKDVELLSWDEIKQLTLYSSDQSKQGKVMLLNDLLKIIKKEVILNIEIKPNGKNDEVLAALVEETIKNEPQHMVCSFSSSALKTIKKINPKRKTGLIMAIALGEYKDLDYIDFYSVEWSFITESAVFKIHEAGKQIFAWTINDSEEIPKCMEYEVDGIITDYPVEMIHAMEIEKKNFSINVFKRLIAAEK